MMTTVARHVKFGMMIGDQIYSSLIKSTNRRVTELKTISLQTVWKKNLYSETVKSKKESIHLFPSLLSYVPQHFHI
jgi:hypothetical protein